MGEDSDIEMLVIMPDGTHRRKTAQKIYQRMRGGGFAKDIVVVTKKDLGVLVFSGRTYCTCGGWIQARIQIDRASTRRGWFMRNRTTVALPVGVKPRRTRPFCIHSKCSDQLWIRGLNRGTVSLVSGSGAAVALALLRLQLGQDKQRFASASGPSGLMCSTCIACPITRCAV